ncbi:MAG: hypothetical protein LCI02_02790 [Proteobacteria bacterium]|nr:hypothetical protein [Pseudomonadota bacterium]
MTPAAKPASHRLLLLLLVAAAGTCAAQTSPSRQQRRAPAPPPPAPAAPLPAADDEQKVAAALAHLGDYECEFDEKVVIAKNPRFEGYLDVKHRKNLWTMKPVLSKTGALRLEDVKGRTLMLQIANKSMLMDVKIGQRLVDNCVHEMQREAMRNRPPGESIGIDPSKAATPAAAASASAPAAAPAAAAASAASQPGS